MVSPRARGATLGSLPFETEVKGQPPRARGAGKNLLGHVSSTRNEARTDAEKFTEAVRLERAA